MTECLTAAVLFETGRPLAIRGGIVIPPLAEGQVLVRIDYSGVCHSQLMEVRGNRGEDPHLPHLLGHEGSGTVLDIGSEVTKVKPGDAVVLGWIKGDGMDAGGVVYNLNGYRINAGAVTTFNDHAVVSENRCYKLPDGLSMERAVLFGCAVPTGCGMVMNDLSPEPDTTIVIMGLGGIGLCSLMMTNAYDFKKVIAIDVNSEKLDLAKELGATDIVNANSCSFVEAVSDITGGGADYSIDAAGLTSTTEMAFEMVRKNGGLCVFASHPDSNARISLNPHDLISGKQIRGSWGGGCQPDRDIPKFAELYQKGILQLDKLPSTLYSLGDVNQALDDLEGKRIGRAVLKMEANR